MPQFRNVEFTHADVLARYIYDSETGVFTHRISHNGVAAGHAAGCIDAAGYRRMRVRGQFVFAHRLAWFYVHGVWPGQLDHKNQVKTDNRLANLREATASQNRMNISNVKPTSLAGIKGVKTVRRKNGRIKFQAVARVNGVSLYLGTFADPQHAAAASRIFRSVAHGEFYAG